MARTQQTGTEGGRFTGVINNEALARHVRDIEELLDERKTLNDRIKEIYQAAKDAGFQTQFFARSSANGSSTRRSAPTAMRSWTPTAAPWVCWPTLRSAKPRWNARRPPRRRRQLAMPWTKPASISAAPASRASLLPSNHLGQSGAAVARAGCCSIATIPRAPLRTRLEQWPNSTAPNVGGTSSISAWRRPSRRAVRLASTSPAGFATSSCACSSSRTQHGCRPPDDPSVSPGRTRALRARYPCGLCGCARQVPVASGDVVHLSGRCGPAQPAADGALLAGRLKRGLPDLWLLHNAVDCTELKRRGGQLSRTFIGRTRRGSPRVYVGQEEVFPKLIATGAIEAIAVCESVFEVLEQVRAWRIPLRPIAGVI